jgi:hypothetical protein
MLIDDDDDDDDDDIAELHDEIERLEEHNRALVVMLRRLADPTEGLYARAYRCCAWPNAGSHAPNCDVDLLIKGQEQ